MRNGSLTIIMPLLTWKHGKSREDALTTIQAAIDDLGYARHVTWKANQFTAHYKMFVTLVDTSGEVTDEFVIVEKSDGRLGGAVLEKCNEMLQRLFPDGEQN